ncbi:MAG: energy-converting hydrogenase subunit EhaL family protein [Methanobacteriaceae archaeon]
MNELSYLLYLIIFVVGAILGLLFSYKKHGEAFIVNTIDIPPLILAILGWALLINYGFFMAIINNIILLPVELFISISILFISFVIGMRPGYGRKETAIGIIITIFIWIITNLSFINQLILG